MISPLSPAPSSHGSSTMTTACEGSSSNPTSVSGSESLSLPLSAPSSGVLPLSAPSSGSGSLALSDSSDSEPLPLPSSVLSSAASMRSDTGGALSLTTLSSSNRTSFVDSLVASSVSIITAIWPQSSTGSISLHKFIQESLKRSRSSYSIFQVALFYLALLKSKNNHQQFNCGRRAFLSSLMVASKYLQDRNYSIKAWSKISGLKASELAHNELQFLKAIEWRVHVKPPVFDRWSTMLLASVNLRTDGDAAACGLPAVPAVPTSSTTAVTAAVGPSMKPTARNAESSAALSSKLSPTGTNPTVLADVKRSPSVSVTKCASSAYPTPILSDGGSDFEDGGKRRRNDNDYVNVKRIRV